MNYLSDNSIKDFVKDILINKLYDYKDTTCYGGDLAYQLLESYSIDGVYFYNNYEATRFVQKHFEDFGEIVEEIKCNLGSDSIPNVFNEPDKFCVVCFLEVANDICSQCEYINKKWNDYIELTDEVIEIIKKEIEGV